MRAPAESWETQKYNSSPCLTAQVLFWSFASLWYKQSNKGFVASQMFVSCFQGYFQHAGQVLPQTPFNLLSYAWQVLGAGLRPPYCMDFHSRDPGPGVPGRAAKQTALKSDSLGFLRLLLGIKPLVLTTVWQVFPTELTGCVRTVSTTKTVQLVQLCIQQPWGVLLLMSLIVCEFHVKKNTYSVCKKVCIQLIVLWNTFYKDWAWGNTSFGKFCLNL